MTHWEYWPLQWVYFPLLPVWLYYAVRSRALFFFNTANPTIRYGGMGMESKKEIYDLMPHGSYPKTVFVPKGMSSTEMLNVLGAAHISYPLITKPDTGMKALAVEKIEDEIALLSYSKKLNEDFLIQELIPFPNELGIFYCRYPNSTRGFITGLVQKEFLCVVGNGNKTILSLIKENPRYHLQMATLKKKYGAKLNEIPKCDEVFELVPFGSHTRGAKFIDVTHLMNDKLFQTIDSLCVQVSGFYFGRMDIRFNTFQELSEGKKYSIIEINGAGSEPTHMYDPKHSLLFAWREITKHWRFLFDISKMNKALGHAYLSYSEGKKMLRDSTQLEKKLKSIT